MSSSSWHKSKIEQNIQNCLQILLVKHFSIQAASQVGKQKLEHLCSFNLSNHLCFTLAVFTKSIFSYHRSRGFKEFGSADNLLNPELHHLTTASVSPISLSPNNNRYLPQRSVESTTYHNSDENTIDCSVPSISSPLPVTNSGVSCSLPGSLPEVSSTPFVPTTSVGVVNHDVSKDNPLQFLESMVENPVMDAAQPPRLQPLNIPPSNTPVDTCSDSLAGGSKQDRIYEVGLDYSDDEVLHFLLLLLFLLLR